MLQPTFFTANVPLTADNLQQPDLTGRQQDVLMGNCGWQNLPNPIDAE